MPELDSFNEKSALDSWTAKETAPLDLVASWETLCSVYQFLQFTDPLTDSVRMEEFKWIIKEMNKFLTMIRKRLGTCTTFAMAIELCRENFIPKGKVTVEDRKTLAFQKFRQQWISQSLNELGMINQQIIEQETVDVRDSNDY